MGSRFQYSRPAGTALDEPLGLPLRPPLHGEERLNATSRFIRTVRIIRLAWHLVTGAAIIVVTYPRLNHDQRLRYKQHWSRRLLEILGVRLQTELNTIEAGSLIVANHVSWLDIFVLNAARPVAFVSKSEVREWPLIGWLAAKSDTVFLRRGSRGHARIVNAEIDALLNDSRDVAVFPEGTTTDGTHLLGFHAALLQGAVETGRPIVALALRYETPDGQHSLAPAYAGQTSLMQCLGNILENREIVARLQLAATLPTPGHSRRELARAAHDAIVFSLGLPLANKAPETLADLPAEPLSDDRPIGSRSRVPED